MIRDLHLAAFAPSTYEAEIVDALRAAGDDVPELCLVAVEDGTLTGHVMISRGAVGEHPALALGPIAVQPVRQHEGIGAALMRAAIDRATQTTYPLLALLGHPAYYPRFGFRPGTTFGITTIYDAPPEAWMVLPLPAYEPSITGRFSYPAAFG